MKLKHTVLPLAFTCALFTHLSQASPMQDFDHFKKDMDAFVSHIAHWHPFHTKSIAYPAGTKLTKNKDFYTLRLHTPGYTKKDVDIQLDENNVLTITGKQSNATKKQAGEVIIGSAQEAHSFSQSFHLGDGIDAKSISAHMKDGILTITFKVKKTTKRTRSISIS